MSYLLEEGGMAAIESGFDRGESAARLFSEQGLNVCCRAYLGGRDRCLIIMSLGVQKRLGHAYIVGASALFMEAIDFSWFLNADRLTALFRGRLHPAIAFTRICSHGLDDADARRLWRKD